MHFSLNFSDVCIVLFGYETYGNRFCKIFHYICHSSLYTQAWIIIKKGIYVER